MGCDSMERFVLPDGQIRCDHVGCCGSEEQCDADKILVGETACIITLTLSADDALHRAGNIFRQTV